MKVNVHRGIYPDDPGGRNGLLNPERGFRLESPIGEQAGDTRLGFLGPSLNLVGRCPPGYTDDWWAINTDLLQDHGVTLILAYCYLDKFYNAPIRTEKLLNLDTSLSRVRKKGMKVLLRFAYERGTTQQTGPDFETIQGHLDQLAPIIQKNADVIYVLQAGMIGAWGEWHNSVQNLENDSEGLARLMKKFVEEVLPKNRMTQMRVPKYKKQVLNHPIWDQFSEVNRSNAFSTLPAARIGYHNDGFLAGKTDGNTWPEPPHFGSAGNPEYDYMTRESRYLPVDGELFVRDQGGEVNGWDAAKSMHRHHYSSFSIAHSYSLFEGREYSIDRWKTLAVSLQEISAAGLPVSDGYFKTTFGKDVQRTMFEYIRDHLGYRLELQKSSFNRTASPGKTLQFEAQLLNRGFARPINPRQVYLALISTQGAVQTFLLDDANPTMWLPAHDQDSDSTSETFISTEVKLPVSLSPGWYSIGLWLPDAAASVRMDPAYSIRFANGDIPWWTDPKGQYGINLLGTVRLR